jgi:hypothetical protein
MKIPLHLSQNDHSIEADQARVELHVRMASLMHHRGFRQPGKVLTRVARLAERAFADENVA